MRLITFNVRQGGGKRIAAQVDALMARNADLVALQEVWAHTACFYHTGFQQAGLHYSTDSFVSAGNPVLLTGRRRSGVLIASRWPFRVLASTANVIPWSERLLSVLIDSPFGPLELHAVYVPVFGNEGEYKLATLEGLYRRLATPAPIPRILCGDFNSPQAETPDGTIVTFGQRIRRDGQIVTRDERHDRSERNILAGLAASDLVDVFRSLHGYDVQEFSWHTPGGARHGFRLDHIFASRCLHPVACTYLHSIREERLSDHSALEAVFDPQQTKT